MGSLTQCKRQRQGMLRQIHNLSAMLSLNNDRGALDVACERYIQCEAVQLYHRCRNAAVPALHWTAEHEYASRISRGFNAIDYRRDYPTIGFWDEPKRSGGSRLVCDLPPCLKMFHQTGLDLLRAIHSPPVAICDWTGRGSNLAVQRLIDALHSEDQYVVLADVTSCFDNVNVEAVAELALLPREFFQSVMLPVNGFTFRRLHAVGPLRASYGHTDNEVVPRGLLQGSPMSNSLFALSVSDFPLGYNPSLALSVLADNVGAVTDSLEDALRVQDVLNCYFSDCRVGPLSLKTEIRRAGDGFQFLGYEISVGADGRPFIDLDDKNWTKHLKRADMSCDTIDEMHTALSALASFQVLSPLARERLEDVLLDGLLDALPEDSNLPDYIMASALRSAIERRAACGERRVLVR